MSSYQPTTAQLRPALQFALELARITPPAELPARVRPIARARRLPPNWAATMRLALEEDDEYRGDVAGEASEERLGEIPWLWLSRPEGWAERVGELVRAALEVDEREKEQTYLEGRIAALQRDLDAASSARDGALAEAARWKEEALELRRRLREAARLADEREARLRSADSRAAEADRLRRDLQVAEESLRRAEEARQAAEEARQAAEEARQVAEEARQAAEEAPEPAGGERRGGDGACPVAAPPEVSDPGGAPPAGEPTWAGALSRLGGVAEELAAALKEVAVLLTGSPVAEQENSTSTTAPAPAAGRRAKRPVRRPLALPPAVFEESPEAAAFLVRAPRARLVVDGYNVTFTSWTGSDLPALRHRLVSALSELALRFKRPVTVVFDGNDAGGTEAAPPAVRKLLRIVFSASDVEADEVIVDTVAGLPVDVPVVVATDDRQVRDNVRRLGANVLSVEQLLGVLGRQPDR